MTRLLLLWLIAPVAFAQTSYKTLRDIAYAPQDKDNYRRERCKVDVYYPENTRDFATIVWFHGGGLTGGEKFIPEALQNKGYAVVAVNYRLSPKANVAGIIDDAAAAVAWTFAHMGDYGGSTQKIFLSGHSAGGYLVAMVGLDKKRLETHGVDANKIAGLIPFSGQMVTHFTARAEQKIPEKQPTIDTLAPLFYVRPDAPPLLLITGDRELELLGRYEENAYMARMMKVSGHTQTKLLELGGYGHMMEAAAYPLLLDEVARILKKS